MAVVVRLRRIGARKAPFFRIVASDSRRATGSRFLEDLGWFDPKKKERNFQIKLDRIEYWTGCGARLSETVRSLVRRAQTASEPATPETPPAPETQPVAN
jgi:small subunit ribosomal protein S16